MIFLQKNKNIYDTKKPYQKSRQYHEYQNNI